MAYIAERMTRIVTTHYRYTRPPGKRKAVALAGPAVVTPKRKRVLLAVEEKKLEPASAIVRKAKPCNDNRPEAEHLPTGAKKSAIVTTRRKPARTLPLGLLPETPEEHNRRGDAADALFRDMKRQIASKGPAVSGSQRAQPVTSTTHKGVPIDIERVRDGGWHWRLNQGEWSDESFFMHADALKEARAAVDALQPPATGKDRA